MRIQFKGDENKYADKKITEAMSQDLWREFHCLYFQAVIVNELSKR